MTDDEIRVFWGKRAIWNEKRESRNPFVIRARVQTRMRRCWNCTNDTCTGGRDD